jgi:hypothetical protein
MARTYSQVIERARRILQDTDAANYRYPQQDLVDSVNDALLEVRRVRPDLFISSSFSVSDVELANIAAVNIPIESHYFQTLVYLTAGYQMLRDDEFSLDSRAVNLLNKGTAQLLSVAS